MSYRERKGLLLTADMSGYTEYLEHAELAHAQAIISQLLEGAIDAAPPGFEQAKLEGDAAFFIVDESLLTGRLVADAIRGICPRVSRPSGGHHGSERQSLPRLRLRLQARLQVRRLLRVLRRACRPRVAQADRS
jgi:hypothetical protein